MSNTPNFIDTGLKLWHHVKKLRANILYDAYLFSDITTRQDYPGSAHKNTECIFVRGPKEFTQENYFESLDSLWNYKSLGALHNTINPIIDKLTKELQFTELGRVLIVKLKPHSKLESHIDEGYYADYYTRFHIPVLTNKDSSLIVDGEVNKPEVGTCVWFNHKKEHHAENNGEHDRIHLIIDAVSEKFKHPNDYE